MKIINYISFAMCLMLSMSTFAQEIQGKAYYQSKTTFETNGDTGQDALERQERMKKRMQRQFEKVYKLSFTGVESNYKVEEGLEQPGESQGGRRRRFGNGNDGLNYRNTQTKVFAKEQNMMGKDFLIKDGLTEYEWTLVDESRMIGNHFCLKATTTKEVSGVQFLPGPPGRNTSNKDADDSIRTVQITAWYTPEIPVNHGPSDYWGLPGLILEVSAGKTQIICTKIVLNPKEKVKIEIPEKGKEITQAKFDKLQVEKIKEIRERIGNRSRKGNRRR